MRPQIGGRVRVRLLPVHGYSFEDYSLVALRRLLALQVIELIVRIHGDGVRVLERLFFRPLLAGLVLVLLRFRVREEQGTVYDTGGLDLLVFDLHDEALELCLHSLIPADLDQLAVDLLVRLEPESAHEVVEQLDRVGDERAVSRLEFPDLNLDQQNP